MRINKNTYFSLDGASKRDYHKICQKLIRDGAGQGEYVPDCFQECEYVGLSNNNEIKHISSIDEFNESDKSIPFARFFSRHLSELTIQEYKTICRSGLLWVKSPEATGSINEDLQAVRVNIHTTKDENGKKKVQHFYDIIDEFSGIELFTSDA